MKAKKLKKRKKHNLPQEVLAPRYNHEYRIVDHPENKEDWCIEVLYPAFAGVLVRYGKFMMGKEADKHGEIPYAYEYNVLHVPLPLDGKDLNKREQTEFETLLGRIALKLFDDYATFVEAGGNIKKFAALLAERGNE